VKVTNFLEFLIVCSFHFTLFFLSLPSWIYYWFLITCWFRNFIKKKWKFYLFFATNVQWIYLFWYLPFSEMGSVCLLVLHIASSNVISSLFTLNQSFINLLWWKTRAIFFLFMLLAVSCVKTEFLFYICCASKCIIHAFSFGYL